MCDESNSWPTKFFYEHLDKMNIMGHTAETSSDFEKAGPLCNEDLLIEMVIPYNNYDYLYHFN